MVLAGYRVLSRAQTLVQVSASGHLFVCIHSAFWNHLVPCKTMWNHLGPSRTFWNHLGPSG